MTTLTPEERLLLQANGADPFPEDEEREQPLSSIEESLYRKIQGVPVQSSTTEGQPGTFLSFHDKEVCSFIMEDEASHTSCSEGEAEKSVPEETSTLKTSPSIAAIETPTVRSAPPETEDPNIDDEDVIHSRLQTATQLEANGITKVLQKSEHSHTNASMSGEEFYKDKWKIFQTNVWDGKYQPRDPMDCWLCIYTEMSSNAEDVPKSLDSLKGKTTTEILQSMKCISVVINTLICQGNEEIAVAKSIHELLKNYNAQFPFIPRVRTMQILAHIQLHGLNPNREFMRALRTLARNSAIVDKTVVSEQKDPVTGKKRYICDQKALQNSLSLQTTLLRVMTSPMGNTILAPRLLDAPRSSQEATMKNFTNLVRKRAKK